MIITINIKDKNIDMTNAKVHDPDKIHITIENSDKKVKSVDDALYLLNRLTSHDTVMNASEISVYKALKDERIA